jgi:cation-transporting ATPase 13A3/4/5
MFNMAVKAEEANCQLCVTGRAFNQLFSGSVENLSLVQRRFMEKATVFARTKPNDKAKIVTVFQQMGKKVSMCGDGANDCGALKQADIGLSLSQAEASISAPFTSQVTNISSMVELIKECRAGLATNFSLFNIMAIYSLIQYTSSLVCEYFLQYPADFQYLYWDICLNFFLILFIGYTGTADKLSV